MIVFERVSKQFPGNIVAVENFSVEIPSHSCLALVGSSGCGKTTLLRMVNRMTEPTSGRVLIDGEDVAHTDPIALRRSIGYVMQNGGLLPHKTVVQNVLTVSRLRKDPVTEDDALEVMEQVGLSSSLAKRYPRELSGGQAQRVGVARALICNPHILLMDEPFAAVDPLVRFELQQQIASLQSELGKTIIFVTHDFAEACYLGDRVAVLSRKGVVEQIGTPSEIITTPQTDFVRAFVQASRRIEMV